MDLLLQNLCSSQLLLLNTTALVVFLFFLPHLHQFRHCAKPNVSWLETGDKLYFVVKEKIYTDWGRMSQSDSEWAVDFIIKMFWNYFEINVLRYYSILWQTDNRDWWLGWCNILTLVKKVQGSYLKSDFDLRHYQK